LGKVAAPDHPLRRAGALKSCRSPLRALRRSHALREQRQQRHSNPPRKRLADAPRVIDASVDAPLPRHRHRHDACDVRRMRHLIEGRKPHPLVAERLPNRASAAPVFAELHFAHEGAPRALVGVSAQAHGALSSKCDTCAPTTAPATGESHAHRVSAAQAPRANLVDRRWRKRE
jgi:hypothetical protein